MKALRLLTIAAVIVLAAATTNAATETAKLLASDGVAADYFGVSLAASSNTVVVGAFGVDIGTNTSAGAAYVLVGGGSSWTQQAKLTANPPLGAEQLGTSVAIDGDTAVIGAPGHDIGGNFGVSAGAVYVFERSGTNWSQQAQLILTNAVFDDFFGQSVAISGDTLAVGVPGRNHMGAVYVFVRSGTTWTQQSELTASDPNNGDFFGWSLTMNSNTVVIGSVSGDSGTVTNSGAAYVFVRNGTNWTEQAKLTASDAAANDQFAVTVGISGDTVAIGAPFADTVAGTDAGATYVFERSGNVWTQQAKLTASDAAAGDRLGKAVVIDGDSLITGAQLGDTPVAMDAGAAYVFGRSGTVWIEQTKLTASDGLATNLFGAAVANAGGVPVIGAPGRNSQTGAAYVFAGASCACAAGQGVVSWWSAEGNANDVIGSNPGVLSNGTTFAAGEVGQAFVFDGVNDFVTAADSSSLRVSNITLEGWINVTSFAGDSIKVIMSKPVGGGSGDSYALYFEGGTLLAGVGTAATFAQLSSSFTPVLGTWYHVAYTFDDAADFQALYVNGVLVASGTTTVSPAYDSSPFFIGAENSPSLTYFFNGLIDEPTIYNRAISAGEVQAIVCAGHLGKCAPLPPPTIACTLQPMLATNQINTAHTVTATVTTNGVARSGALVNFSVTAGPNFGHTGTATTAGNGQGSFTYTGSGGAGTDNIRAIATLASLSATGTATKVWISAPPSNSPPVAVCQNVTTNANGSCVQNVPATAVDNHSFDNDGTITSRSLSPTGPYSLGVHGVTLTVVDDQGASNSCDAMITVLDQTNPSILCSGNIVSNVPFGNTSVTCTAVDGAGNTNTCTFTITVTQAPPAADLALSKSATPDPAIVGNDLTYTLVVTNLGPNIATSVTVTDRLPARVDFVSATPSQGTCTQIAGIVTCDLGDVATRATVDITVNPTAIGSICNTAVVAGLVTDPNSTNNTAAVCTPVHVHDLALVSIKAAKTLTLTSQKMSQTKFVRVTIQNRSDHDETIQSLGVLSNLVTLVVESLGTNCPNPDAVFLTGPPQRTLPVTLKPKQKFTVIYDVTYNCANDPLKGAGHEDLRYHATVHHEAIDGQPDNHPVDDVCPHNALPGGVDPFPDGKVKDNGCGGKTTAGTLGADVLTDVVVK
jgi:uncharacterized repeat protein (TIGR01451 family)